jgi:hypothetical protein
MLEEAMAAQADSLKDVGLQLLNYPKSSVPRPLRRCNPRAPFCGLRAGAQAAMEATAPLSTHRLHQARRAGTCFRATARPLAPPPATGLVIPAARAICD